MSDQILIRILKENNLFTDALINYMQKLKENDCQGCYYQSASQKHHTCLDASLNSMYYAEAVRDLYQKNQLEKEICEKLSEWLKL